MKCLRIFLLIVVLVSLSACSLADSPEKAAREWIDALLNMDGNKLAARTCAAQQENLQNATLWLSAFAVLGEMLTGQQTEADVSDLQFTTISKSGDTAQVRITGEIRTAVLAMAQTQQVDETWQMVREEGRWKWCGSTEMQEAGPTAPPVVTILPQATSPPAETPEAEPSFPQPQLEEQSAPTATAEAEQAAGGAYERAVYEEAKTAAAQADWVLATLLFGEAYRANPDYADVAERLDEARRHSGRILVIQNDQVVAVSVDGGEIEPLFTTSDVPDLYSTQYPRLHWSPSGNQIAYQIGQLWVMNGDGTGYRHLLEDTDLSIIDIDWSPDEQQILFNTQFNVGVIDVANSKATIFQGCVSTGQFRGVAWAHSGERIAVCDWWNHRLVTASSDGNNCRVLAEGIECSSLLSWSQDDQSVILGSEGVLYRIPHSGGSPVEIARVGAAWSHMGALVLSPDGDYLAVAVDHDYVIAVNVTTGEGRYLLEDIQYDDSLGWLPVSR